MTRGVGTPSYVTYDPVWADGDPVEPGYPLGYRTMVSLFASPSYHPNTMIVMVMDNEEYANSPPAIGRRSASTGAWEQAAGPVDKVALIDYGDGAGAFVWQDYMPPVFWPPASGKLYTFRFDSGGSDADFWWVELDADYPFTFSKRSDTPAEKGLAGQVWDGLNSLTWNADGSMLCAFHDGDGSSDGKWSMWAPGPNIVSYFRDTDAAFAGLWDADSIPSGAVIDKHDHLWIITSLVVTDSPGQMFFDEFSWTVGLTDITLTHLNRYELINQDGGFNTWTYDCGAGPFSYGGVTYNEDLDALIVHWQCRFESVAHLNHDPPNDFGGAFQHRITIWDLATRSKKLSEADSVLLTKAIGGTPLFTGDIEQSGHDGFLGTLLNQKGDRMFGTWTKQDWTCYAAVRTGDGDSQHDGFYFVDVATGVGTKYGPDVWADFITFDTGDDPGVYSFAGAIYEPLTEKFWAGRRNEGLAGHLEGGTWYYTTDGLGIYGWDSPPESDCAPCEEDTEPCGDTVEPPCNAEWPFALLQPTAVGIHMVPATIGGGSDIAGGHEETTATANGFWRVTYSGIRVHDRDQVLKLRELAAVLEGGAGVICIHAYDGKRAPWLTVGDTIVASSVGAFTAGGTSGSIRVTSGGVLRPGMFWSWEDRLYCLKTVGTPTGSPPVYPVTVFPNIRAEIADGELLEFTRPMVRARLANDEALNLELDLLEHNSLSLEFEEDI